MQCHEPEVSDAGAQKWVQVSGITAFGEPIEKDRHLLLQTVPRWCFEVHGGPVDTA
ncbi:hypothetical protein D3C71_2250250 [compost metagenome]